MKTFKQFILESKQVGILYHLLTLHGFEHVLKTKNLESKNYYKISTTRNKNLKSYLGSGGATLFKLELDGNKLSNKYKISPFQYSLDGIPFNEFEEIISTDKIKEIWKYTNKLIFHLDEWEKIIYSEPKYWKTQIKKIKKLFSQVPISIYIQKGTKIFKDDKKLKELGFK